MAPPAQLRDQAAHPAIRANIAVGLRGMCVKPFHRPLAVLDLT